MPASACLPPHACWIIKKFSKIDFIIILVEMGILKNKIDLDKYFISY
tara:strand:+ start:1194 stop:1334 length:141 start_codon:yes stop_codon:yes gene_type:complete